MKTASLVCCLFVCLSLPAQDRVYAIKAARLFDGASDRLVEPGLVTVSNGKIVSVGGAAPAGATVIDLGDATLLPGFIDVHTHLSDAFNPDYDDADAAGPAASRFRESHPRHRERAYTLTAGFTTVRDLGGSDFIDVGLRNAIDAGVIPGPRMLVSVHALGSTGGHCDDGAGFRFGLFGPETGPEQGVINSPDQARYAVRFNIKYGADMIKTCASGGVLSPTDDVDVPQLSQAELNALVDEAHALRRKAAAHAHGAEAAKRAIRAGIDSIEHGTFLDDEALRMMHDTRRLPGAHPDHARGSDAVQAPAAVHEKAMRAVAQQDAMVRRALALGVRVALGTDAGVYPHGQNATEFALMVAAGMTPAQSLKAGMPRWPPSFWACRIRLARSGRECWPISWRFPATRSTNIKTTSEVVFVMKEGAVFRNERH